jgi:hypothetical protein
MITSKTINFNFDLPKDDEMLFPAVRAERIGGRVKGSSAYSEKALVAYSRRDCYNAE